MSKQVIQTITANTVETLIDALKTLTLTDPSVVYVEGPSGGTIKLSCFTGITPGTNVIIVEEDGFMTNEPLTESLTYYIRRKAIAHLNEQVQNWDEETIYNSYVSLFKADTTVNP